MSSGRKWFALCAALVFLVGFLSGIIVSPMIFKPEIGRMMGMRMRRDMLPGGPVGHGLPGGPDMDLKMGPDGRPDMKPGEHGGLPMGPGGEHGMRIGAMIDRIVDDLGFQLSLSADQKKRIKKIFEDGAPEQLAFHKEMRDRLQKIRKKMDSQIMQVLDEKQKKKFKEITSSLDNHMP